jgi:inositol phosphorylceramide mannosyltransferase catalytic subunit
LLLTQFGGFYSDLDVECLRDHTPIAQCGGVVVPLMSNDFGFAHNVPNAWFGSAPNHPFWLYLLASINAQGSKIDGAEAITGPAALYHALQAYVKLAEGTSDPPVYHMAAGLVFPYDWHDNKGRALYCSAQSLRFSERVCKAMIGVEELKSFTITFWAHSWADNVSLENLHNQ